MASVTIIVGAHANVDTGFARVRMAARNLRRSLRDNFTSGGANAGQSFLQRVINVLNQGAASLFQAGQGMGQQVGQGLGSAGSNPYVAAGIAALVAAVAPAIGAALAGAITLAFGGAFVGLGVFLLKDNDKVKKAWGKTMGGLKKDFAHAADGLIPVVTHAMDLLGKMGKKFAPEFKKAMDEAAPHLTKFIDKLASGIEKFGKKAFKPMMDAFDSLLDSIDLESFFGSLGDAFAYMGKAVKDNSKAIGLLFNILLGAIPVAIRVLGFLVKWWGFQVAEIKLVIKFVKLVIDWIGKIAGKTVHFAQKGIETIIRWVKNVRDWVKGFKGKTVSFFQKGVQGIINIVRSVRNWISGMKGKTVSFAQRGIGAIISGIRTLKGWISGLKGKVIHIGASISGLARKFIPGFAHGGIIGHAAGGGPRSNLTLVGEQGPELVDLAPGSRVRSNSDSRRMLSMGGGAPIQHVTFEIDGKVMAEALIDPFRGVIRKKGGNVQTVLGR